MRKQTTPDSYMRKKHKQIWRAIDDLAALHGLSASGLAVRSGLDPTCLNVSKRTHVNGQPRWPNMGSIFAMLAATKEDLLSFAKLLEKNRQHRKAA